MGTVERLATRAGVGGNGPDTAPRQRLVRRHPQPGQFEWIANYGEGKAVNKGDTIESTITLRAGQLAEPDTKEARRTASIKPAVPLERRAILAPSEALLFFCCREIPRARYTADHA